MTGTCATCGQVKKLELELCPMVAMGGTWLVPVGSARKNSLGQKNIEEFEKFLKEVGLSEEHFDYICKPCLIHWVKTMGTKGDGEKVFSA